MPLLIRGPTWKDAHVAFPGPCPSHMSHLVAPLTLSTPDSYLIVLQGLSHRCWVLFNGALIGLSAPRLLWVLEFMN